MIKIKFLEIISINRIINALLYLLSFFLLTFYLFLLILSTRPQVSLEYQTYYIQKELKNWGGNSSFSYTLGTPLLINDSNVTINTRMSAGWSHLETDGCWTDGYNAKLWFKDLPDKNLTVYIEIADILATKSITAYGNGQLLGNITRSALASDNIWLIDLPERVLSHGELELRFQINEPQSTPTDSRKLGVKIRKVLIDE
ncbi:MAG: hypothetical protein SPI21_07380 [Hungatella hathewayi]|uniref:hypothetical protein n=1 Tax=Hungatella TaxID=1649459 RepID=UPI001106A024|nr:MULTISPECIES: hypothetical protein [Hungatella]MCI7382761.1 hypothetical protein [Hungatella sp.]MDY6236593.1 hypothetical protein [Hungatella hathewayi]